MGAGGVKSKDAQKIAKSALFVTLHFWSFFLAFSFNKMRIFGNFLGVVGIFAHILVSFFQGFVHFC